MPQTLCPYLNVPLALIAEVDAEHIIPAGIGAPDKLTVLAAVSENRRLNREIDEPFINDPVVKLAAARSGATSRYGRPVSATIGGSIQSTGERIRGRFSKDGLKASFVSPVSTDENGNVTSLRGFEDDDLSQHATHMAERYRRKGVRLEFKEGNPLTNPDLEFDTTADLTVIVRALAKAAYLMTVRTMGDEAIASPSGLAYRSALEAKTIEAMRETQVRFVPFAPFPPDFRESKVGEFVLTCRLLPRVGLVSAVSLFGLFDGIFITSAQGLTSGIGSGEEVVIDVATKRLHSERYRSPLASIRRR